MNILKSKIKGAFLVSIVFLLLISSLAFATEEPVVHARGGVMASASIFNGSSKVSITSLIDINGTAGNNFRVELTLADTNTKTCELINSFYSRIEITCDTYDSDVSELVDAINESANFIATGGSSKNRISSRVWSKTLILNGGVTPLFSGEVPDVKASVSVYKGSSKVIITSSKNGVLGNNTKVKLTLADTNTKTCELINSFDKRVEITCDTYDSDVSELVDAINESGHFIATGGSSKKRISSRVWSKTLILNGGVTPPRSGEVPGVKASVSIFNGSSRVIITSAGNGDWGNNTQVELTMADTNTGTCELIKSTRILKITCDTYDSDVSELVDAINESGYFIATGGSSKNRISSRVWSKTLILNGGVTPLRSGEVPGVKASVSIFNGSSRVIITSSKNGILGNITSVELTMADTKTKTCEVINSTNILKITCDTYDSDVSELVDAINESGYFIATGGSSKKRISSRVWSKKLILSGGKN